MSELEKLQAENEQLRARLRAAQQLLLIRQRYVEALERQLEPGVLAEIRLDLSESP